MRETGIGTGTIPPKKFQKDRDRRSGMDSGRGKYRDMDRERDNDRDWGSDRE